MSSNGAFRRALAGMISILAVAAAATLLEAAPQLKAVSSRGLKIGAAAAVAIEGAELTPGCRLIFSHPGISGVVRSETTGRLEAAVQVDSQTPPGIYFLRLATDQGVSVPLAIGVDSLAQLPFQADLDSLPAALTGAVSGSGVLKTSFSGKRGERVVAEVECRRLGSDVQPVVRILDERRVQLAWSPGIPSLGGDPRCELILPADGRYTIELHDLLYRAGETGDFRLKIGDFHYADLVFPLALSRGSRTPLSLAATSLPVQNNAVFSFAAAHEGFWPAPWPTGVAALAGSPPTVLVSDLAEVAEAPRAAEEIQELPALPVGVSGRLSVAKEEDRYKIRVAPGQTLRLEVLAHRVGSALDGVLSVLNEQGATLATGDDQPGTRDPGLDFTVPADVKAIIVAVRDLQGATSDKHLYRLTVKSQKDPDFSLAAAEDRVHVPRQGAVLLRVRVDRKNYDGPIQLAVLGDLPPADVAGATIPAGASEALVSFQAGDRLPSQAIIRIVGQAMSAERGLIERPLLMPESPLSKNFPWVRYDLPVAATLAAPLAVLWDDAGEGRLEAGGQLPLKVRIARGKDVAGQVRLALLTSQPQPKKTVKVNNLDQVVDDVERALRLAAVPLIAADQDRGEGVLVVPGDLPRIAHDVAIRAELLAADGKSVAASATTPARRYSAVDPPPAKQ